ncbi:MAG: hypothetical protein Q9169_001076 [Polycauliona sp. 2 TL-2023]
MAPAPTPRITRSTKTPLLTDVGKSPPRVTKKSKKPDTASRPYRSKADGQNHSDSSDSQPERASQKAETRSPRKRNANRVKPNPKKQSTPAKEQSLPSRGSKVHENKHKPNQSRLHPDTEAGESELEPKSSDSFKKHAENSGPKPFIGKVLPPSTSKATPINNLHQDLLSFPHLCFDHAVIENLLAHTQPQTPSEIAQCYHDLRSAAWTWAQETFDHNASSADPPALNLMDLANTQPELMEHINSTTASPQIMDWEDWIEKRKAAIVYAILGKVIEVHVFGEELFGADDQMKRELRGSDRVGMDEDGFQRQHHRSQTISSLLPHQHALPPNFIPALQSLQGQLVSLFSPLLQSTSTQTHPSTLLPSNPLSTPLYTILLTAANLAIAIRRNPTSTFYFLPAPSPGSKYDKQEMSALNSAHLDIAMGVEGVREMVSKGGIRSVVGVGGWPGCVGYWPAVRENDGNEKGNGGEKGKRKGKMGIQTQILAKADVWIILEAVDRHAESLIDMGDGREKQKQKGRTTLRSELWSRSLLNAPYEKQRAQYEKEISKLQTWRKAGFIIAATLALRYLGVPNYLWRAVVNGEGTWEEFVVRRRGIWLENLRGDVESGRSLSEVFEHHSGRLMRGLSRGRLG